MYTVDLHNHTKFSYDGSNTPEEIIENAIRHGVDVIGITDHQFSIGENLPIYYEYKDNVYLCHLMTQIIFSFIKSISNINRA